MRLIWLALAGMGVLAAVASKPSPQVVTVGIVTLFIQPLDKMIQKKYLESFGYTPDKIKEILERGSYISDSYINWLHDVQVYTYAIDISMPEADLVAEIERYDAILLTGGREIFYTSKENASSQKIPSEYLKKIEKIVLKVKEINDNKRNFPMWCTCLGFEAVLITESRYSLIRHDADNEARKGITLEPEYSATSRVSRFFSKDELGQLSKLPLTFFNHKFGLYEEEVLQNEWLKGNITPLAYVEKKGHRFLAWYEFKNYPIIGTQFHPEKFVEFKNAPQDSLEFKQYHFNAKMGELFRSLVVNPVIYLQDFGAMKLKKEKQGKDPFSRTDSIYIDSSMSDDSEDHFSLTHVGVYDKIEIFMRKNDTQY